jgi:hypothetical protein
VAVKHAIVTVGVAATDITSGVTDHDDRTGPGVKRTLIVQVPSDGVTVFLGGPDVTSNSFGYELPAGQEAGFDLAEDDVLWAAVAAATQVVNTLHMGV